MINLIVRDVRVGGVSDEDANCSVILDANAVHVVISHINAGGL